MYQALPAIHIRILGEPGNEAKRDRYMRAGAVKS